MKKKYLLFFCIGPLIILLSWTLKKKDPVSPALRVDGGMIRGIFHPKTGVTSYKGIPFAAPPVGELRWKEPQPVIPWKGIRQCAEFGPSPMQPKPTAFLFLGP